MEDWNEEELDKFIKENRDLIIKGRPTEIHEEKFLTKLHSRFKEFVDLTPYLVKVAIVTIIVFICSALIWNTFIRKDKNKPIIENVIDQFKKK